MAKGTRVDETIIRDTTAKPTMVIGRYSTTIKKYVCHNRPVG